jgi:hypothetical protein
MPEFSVGDRVRVRQLPAVGTLAGKAGVVVGVSRTLNDAPDGYHVKLDVGLSGNRTDNVGVAFGPAELEPVTAGEEPATKPKGKDEA